MPYYPQTPSYAPPNPLSYRNILGRNGGFEVWQRGAGDGAAFALAPSTSQYTADGWWFFCGANQASIASRGGGLVNGSRSSGIFFRNPGQTGVGQYWLEYPLDRDEIALACGQLVTLSVTILGGANFSPASGTVYVVLYVGTGAPTRRINGAYTGETAPISATALNVVPGATARFIVTSTVIVPVNASQASLVFLWTPVGTAGANDWMALDDVQLEIGTQATPFERRPFEQELAACRRYYNKSFDYSVAPAGNTGAVGAIHFPSTVGPSTFCPSHGITYAVTMRNAPTVQLYNPQAVNVQIRNISSATDCSASGPGYVGSAGFSVSCTTSPTTALSSDLAFHYTADAGI